MTGGTGIDGEEGVHVPEVDVVPPPAGPEHDPALRDRVARLVGVLRRAALARTRPVRHTRQHLGMLPLVDVADQSALRRPTAAGDEVLRVPRVPRETPPPRPPELDGHVDGPEPPDPTGEVEPRLHDGAEPVLAEAFGQWHARWLRWRDRDRARRPRAATYDALFDLHRLAADQPEAVELVLAGGLLHAPSATGTGSEDVHVHLLTRAVRIDRDTASGDMVVTLATDGVLRLEDDELLAGTELVDLTEAAAGREALVDKLASPLDPALAEVLGEWGRCLRVEHSVGDDWIAPEGPGVRVVPAPALVARRRGAGALRTWYDRLAADVADPSRPLPVGLAQLVAAIEPADRAAWLARTGHDAAVVADPLFPLPVGAAQGRILTRLGRDSGVVVEGPPGTGKTHTIANLLCALLAEGRRVLVTSEKAQALRILRDKLPPEMRDLCVSLADPGSETDADLAASISGLASRSTEFDPDDADREIADLDARRTRLVAERDAVLDGLVAARGAESAPHRDIAPGFAGTPAAVARQVVRTRERDGWLAELLESGRSESGRNESGRNEGGRNESGRNESGRNGNGRNESGRNGDGHGTLGVGLPAEPPLGPAEAAELVALLARETPARRARSGQVLPPPVELPPESHVAELAATVGRGDAAAAGDVGDLVTALGQLPPAAAQHLVPVCRRAADAVVELEETGEDHEWARGVADAVLSGRAAHLWARAVEQLGQVDRILTHDRDAGPAQVRVADEVDAAAAAPAFERFAAHLAAGGAVKRMFKADEQKAVEPHLEGVRVHGADTSTAAGAAAAGHHLRILEITDQLTEAFGPLGYPLRRAEHRSMLVEQALALRAGCLQVGAVLTAAHQVRGVLAALPAARRPRIDGLAALERVSSVALDVTDSRSADLARAELSDIVERVQAGAPVHRQAPELVRVVDALRRRDTGGYVDALAAVDAARVDQRDQRRADQLASRLHAAVPGLVDALRREVAPVEAQETPEELPGQGGSHGLTEQFDPTGGDAPGRRSLADALGADGSGWPRAWAHARAAAWLRTEHPGHAERPGLPGNAGHPSSAGVVVGDGEVDPDARLADLDVELGRLTGRLAAAKAWRACLGRAGAEQIRALQSHRASTAAVGRGTGRYAERFREAARDAVEVARDAVPAWVMPIREVLSVVPPEPDRFDVVIVDEASQADLTSLFLLWLAPRVIVVGDDRQCTPAEVALGSLEPVFARLETDLADVPLYLRSQFTPRSSVFSVFRTTFGPPVRLREHFRSMPEIVSWSSGEFYADAPLVPLRRFGADRLPPLRATYVPDARVRGSGAALTNPVEAVALVDAVVRCAGDPAYDGATFGVVVLQGHGQVELIDGMLRERLDAEQWEARRVRVGVAADFQGDERTVVWLSMVVAPGHRLVALTADRYRQSLNVAASRARDQLWLFHAVTVDELGPTDLRRSLLEHVTAARPAGAPGEVPTGVTRDHRHPAFGSLFEQRVFADLTELGYVVVPQVELHGRRLDLVVTGAAGQLAVACDGDGGGHGPATRADVDREQDLRRCGWSVVRVRESEYVLDPAAALAPVLATLQREGIAAPGTGATPPVVVVEESPGASTTTTGDRAEYVPRHARADGAIDAPTEVIGPEPADPVALLVDDLAELGFPPPRRDAEVRDPAGGAVLSRPAALWPTGISRRALAAPVVVDLAPEPAALERLRGLGYQVFTSVADVRRHVAGTTGEPVDPPTRTG